MKTSTYFEKSLEERMSKPLIIDASDLIEHETLMESLKHNQLYSPMGRISNLRNRIFRDVWEHLSLLVKPSLHPEAFQVWIKNNPYDPERENEITKYIDQVFKDLKLDKDHLKDIEQIEYEDGVLSVSRKFDANVETGKEIPIVKNAINYYFESSDYSEAEKNSELFKKRDRNTKIAWIGGGLLVGATAIYFLSRKK